VLAALAAVAVLALTGMGWAGYRNLSGGITTSQALAGRDGSGGGEQNILIMGLDSRLDQHGQPLPQDIYDALHAGDETVGGYNANVLILLHFPGGGAPVTAVSIPRDDYVDIPGCPSSVCKGKIKQAYGNAYQQTMDSMDTSTSDPEPREQTAREAGRKAEIATVRSVLGVPIDHFIEVTLGAFFQIARVVEPITVCQRRHLRRLLGSQFSQRRPADRRRAGDGVRPATPRRERSVVHRPRSDSTPASVHSLAGECAAQRRCTVQSQRAA
jgi:anionic cell wall polymer biosynthesis LytR-Cps2A-Psr (LCP) family protein